MEKVDLTNWKVKGIERLDRRTKKPAGMRWEFRAYSPSSQRYERVPNQMVPTHILTSQKEEEVQAFTALMNAQSNALALRKRVRNEWVKKYPNLDRLVYEFIEWRKRESPNSWQNEEFYLRSYALKFFTEQSPSDETRNVLNWNLYFDPFLVWLDNEKPLKVARERLAKNTQNKIISVLNLFLVFIGKKVGAQFSKCKMYRRDEVNEVRAEDLFSEEEYSLVKGALVAIRKDSHDLFVFLRSTGMRINEALGVCLPFVMQGHLEGVQLGKLHFQLQKYELDRYYGYICLESQLALAPARAARTFVDRFDQKWEVGSVPRKPLKCRKKIDPKWCRFIPVFDKEAWNIIAERWNREDEKLQAKRHSENPRDYLLFDGITASMFYQDLMKACKAAGVRFRKPHILRHMFLTWFYAETNEDRLLAKKVGGHEDERTMQIYSHLAEQIGLERKRLEQVGKKMKIVD